MIYITGDIHGSPERLGMHSFYEQKEMTRDDIVIICGDFGMVWEESGESASDLVGQAAMISEMVLLIRQKMKTGVRQLKNGIKSGRCIALKVFHGGNRSFRHKGKWITVLRTLNVLEIKWITLSLIRHLQV